MRVARVYAGRTAEDGIRVLVDRLWPRGMTKTRADLDDWCRQVAPTTELRKWYAHDPELFAEFSRRYRKELTAGPQAEALAHMRDLAAAAGNVTLLTASQGSGYQRGGRSR
jgi:uncharacterized protein YeaO (DUF488 family)